MKFLVALVSACVAVGFAAPAYGDTTHHDDAGFLAALRQAGIGYSDPARTVEAAQAVCTCLADGESGLGLVHDVEARNPGFTMDSAAQFALTSAKYYCPQQLSKK